MRITKSVATAVLAIGLPVSSLAAGTGTALASGSLTVDPVDRIHAALLDHSPNADLLIASHRGQWRDYPENSLPGIEQAIADGAEVVEIDVQRTADGQLVLMHDDTVDRMTNGTGRVDQLTLAQIKSLRLREGLGLEPAPVTQYTVPTFEEVMEAVKGKAMVNVDKAWPIRDQVYDVLAATDTVDQAIFKGSPTVEEATEFMARDDDILYMHLVEDPNADQIGAFPGRQPVAYEVTFDSFDDAQVQPDALAAMHRTSRVWVDTMWGSLAADHTDESTLRGDPRNWDALVDRLGASMFLTDNIEAMNYWRAGQPLALYDRQPGSATMRIQAEAPIPGGEGVGYHEVDANQCANVSPEQPELDVCDRRGARTLGFTSGGEWVKYRVDVRRRGTYDISARVGSPYTPAAAFVLEWDGQPGKPFQIQNTTNPEVFERQPVERRQLEPGVHELVLRIPAGVELPQYVNIDYFQLDIVRGPVTRG